MFKRCILFVVMSSLWTAGCADNPGESANTANTTHAADTSSGATTEDAQPDTSINDILNTSTGDTETSADSAQEDSSDADDTQSSEITEPQDTSADSTDNDTTNECESGLLCGQPVECCPLGSECIQGQCLTACDSGVRCGPTRELCCDAGNVCISDACAAPSGVCLDSYDCAPGQFCEPTLGQCLPQPPLVTCQVIPVFSDIQAEVEWSFTDHDIISIPLVADITGDSASEVVVNVTQSSNWPSGEIVVLDGQSGAVKWRNAPGSPLAVSRGAHGRSTQALGDVSGDGKPDIIYAARPAVTTGNGGPTPICAMNGEGVELWCSHMATDPLVAVGFDIENGAITTANLDDDAQSEVIVGAALIDHDGTILWNEGGDGTFYGTNGTYRGGISAVADLDGDGKPEIISGRQAWKVDWPQGSTPTITNMWTYGTATEDGYPAVADFDGDGRPEVALVSRGRVFVLEGNPSPGQLNAVGALWCGGDPTGQACAGGQSRTQPVTIPGAGIGGPPTVADFDNDGRPEIGVAGGGSYSVYDLNRASFAGQTLAEDVPPTSIPTTPENWQFFVRWSQATQDLSSNATGSSVFDFQGDGEAEVVYGDECFMRVYSGSDGRVQLEVPSTNATIHEYPLVVDVDGDGNSEILIVSTNSPGNCPVNHPARKGLFVYGDNSDQWVPTRRIWTQHTYHVTNATSAGVTPISEINNWQTIGLNNYRQNVQGEGVFNAPDLAVDLSIGLRLCGQGQLELLAAVSNNGALGVPAGVEVTFYLGDDAATGTLLGTATTQDPLLPGASTMVALAVEQPPFGTSSNYVAVVNGEASALVVECDGSNNDGRATTVSCTIN